MTTKVTIDTHAGWPVKVVVVDEMTGMAPVRREEMVPANTVHTMHVYNGRYLEIHEVQTLGAQQDVTDSSPAS